jgi:transglutaminase-like putative cysteine protease/tetratricopeptide (TPR) repeat protein
MRRASLLYLALLLCLPTLAESVSPLQLLWQNKLPEAKTAARTALHARPANATALFTLALTAEQEDAPLAAVDAWARYLLAAPDSWQAQAYWPAYLALVERTGTWRQLATVAKAVAAAPRTTPHLRAAARLALARAAVYRNALAEADALYAGLGYLRKWMVVGPFENVSHSGFDRAFPPEEGINYRKTYSGLNQRAIGWVHLGFVSPAGVCLLNESVDADEASIIYAVTAVSSPKAQAAWLRLDRTGAVKVLLNGAEVLRDERYQQRNALLADTYAVPVALRAGWNTLLVKMATNDDTRDADVRLRLTDAAGQPLPGLTIDPAHAAGAAKPDKMKATESVWLTDLPKQPTGPEVALAASAIELAAGEKQAAIDRLQAALKTWPQCAVLHWALSEAYAEDEQGDEAQAERAETRKLSKRIAEAELAETNSRESDLTNAEFQKALRVLALQFPGSDEILWDLSNAYQGDEKTIDAIKAAKAAMALAPGVGNRQRLIAVFDGDGRDKDVDAAITQGLALFPNDTELLNQRAGKFEEKKKKREVLEVRRQIERIDGPTPDSRAEIARLLENQNDRKGAETILRTLRGQCPYNIAVCRQLAQLLEKSKRKTEAAALYERIIELDPSSNELREKVQALLGQKSPLDLVTAVPGAPIIAKAKTAKSADDVSVQVLLSEKREVLYPDMSSESESHLILKICTDAGKEHWQMAGGPMMYGRTKVSRIFKPNGKIINCVDDAYDEGGGLSKVEKGDILEFVNRDTDTRTGSLAKHFWTEWAVMGNLPIQQSRYALLVPAGVTLTTRAHGRDLTPKITEVKGWKQYEWIATDVPADKDEPLEPEGNDNGIWVDISTLSSWGEIVAWYKRLSDQICVPDAAVRKKALELTKDAKTEEEKINAIAAFVSNEIEYGMSYGEGAEPGYTPMKGQKVLRLKRGDCKGKSALLVALLGVVGIKAEMVLLSPRDHGVTPYLPSTRFNHAIALIYTAQGPRYVDATTEHATAVCLPPQDQGVPALIINDATKELTTIPQQPLEQYVLIQETKGTLSADGKFTGAYAFTLNAFQGAQLRALLKKIPEEKHKELMRDLLKAMLPTAVMQSGTIEGLKDAYKPFTFNLAIRIDHQASVADDLFIARMPTTSFMSKMNEAIAEEGRTKDIEAGQVYGIYIDRTTLTLPKGYAPVTLPPRSEFTAPWGHYVAEYRLDGDVLTIALTVKITQLRVPIADLAKFQEFIKGMIACNGKQVVFKKAP